MDTGIDLDSAIVVAVPLFCDAAKLCALLVGLKVKLFVLIDEAVGRQCDICLDACFSSGFRCSIGIIVKIGNGCDAKAEALGDGKAGSGFCAAAVHLVLFFQLLFQCLRIGKIIAVTAQHGGRKMGVAVYKTRQQHHAGAVYDGLGLLFWGGFADVGNLAVFYAKVCAEQHIHFFVHGHNGDIGN